MLCEQASAFKLISGCDIERVRYDAGHDLAALGALTIFDDPLHSRTGKICEDLRKQE
jgi:hypothetical protein